MSLCSCGNSDRTDRSEEYADRSREHADYEAKKAIQKYIEDTPIPKGYSFLIKRDVENLVKWLTVSCEDGEAEVSIRAAMPYTIPYAAELYLPIVQEAAGVTLARFNVNCCRTNNIEGIIDTSWASWQTKDGVTGVFTDTTNIIEDTTNSTVVKPGWTLEQVYEYYADFDGVVQSGIIEEGGSVE